jgi:hypothetical protein
VDAPCAWLAVLGVRVFGPALLHAGSSGTVVAMAAGVLAALALVSAWFDHVVVALGLCAGAAVWFESAGLFGRFERRSLLLPRPALPPAMIYGAVVDATLLLALTFPQQAAGESLLARGFAPMILLGLVRLVPPVLRALGFGERRLAAWLEDRAVLAVILGAAAFGGLLRFGVAVLALGLLVTGILAVSRQNRLTAP